MTRSRWPHTVTVDPVGGVGEVKLLCRCGWQSQALTSPTVSLLTNLAWDHRRAMRPTA